MGCSLPLRLVELNLHSKSEVRIRDLDLESLAVVELSREDTGRLDVLLGHMYNIRPRCYLEAYQFASFDDDGNLIYQPDKLFLDESRERLKFCCEGDDVEIRVRRKIFIVEDKQENILMAGIADSVTPGLSITGVLDQLRFVPFCDPDDERTWAACRRLIDEAVSHFQEQNCASFVLAFEGALAGPPMWSRLGISSRMGHDYGPGFTWVLSADAVPAFISYIEQWTGAEAEKSGREST